ncbi:hypothetical protein LTR23_001969 [Exophiala sp. CCFEE 6169]|nr:hypothetical protein LTR23_001969 [Chaetothyriales sp. CCFEE 6169]
MREHKSATNVSLGIDCHLSNPSSIALQARALLRLARLEHNNRLLADGQFPAAIVSREFIRGSLQRHDNPRRQMFRLGTARVSMLSAAEYDLVTAIVRFSEAADVKTVIINGVVRKRNGRLVEVAVSGGGVEGNAVGGKKTSMPCSQIADEVRKSQKDIQARVEGTVYRAKQEYAPGYVSC